MNLQNLPTRAATGAYILHAGLSKWRASTEVATGTHGMAASAFPVFKSMEPAAFVKLLSAGEMATGAALLLPVVPAGVAGLALTGFSGALVTMYLRTPALRNPGSVWPSPQGIGVSKDVWMLGIGLGLLVDALQRRRGDC